MTRVVNVSPVVSMTAEPIREGVKEINYCPKMPGYLQITCLTLKHVYLI